MVLYAEAHYCNSIPCRMPTTAAFDYFLTKMTDVGIQDNLTTRRN